MIGYDATMATGEAQYRDVLDGLAAAGLAGVFTQTGGMCAAIEVLLDGGHTLLATDAEDTLSWDRADHRGWTVGLYRPDGARNDGPVAFETTSDGSPEALVDLARAVLRRVARRTGGAVGDRVGLAARRACAPLRIRAGRTGGGRVSADRRCHPPGWSTVRLAAS